MNRELSMQILSQNGITVVNLQHSWRLWALHNHPDKGGNKALFQQVLQAVQYMKNNAFEPPVYNKRKSSSDTTVNNSNYEEIRARARAKFKAQQEANKRKKF